MEEGRKKEEEELEKYGFCFEWMGLGGWSRE